ncbi:hypothetical protein [Burkholderia cenocepacia]|uniref:hypothetical protein n=2 Tax=Burkholderia TaxID=32008 RepID=UPI000885DFC7|nr:hypothetical protein [Burkholderia cenocepacia]MBR8076068.1 hypothetical protein [Burkholderia cenocepacia]MBR8507394.1 hypothetical protein [Burkholderia cenocepacia]SDR54739.1 hypothetical protein SAMN05443026_5842 [Burkholderia orbicola]
MNEQDAKNFENGIAMSLAHTVGIAAALALASKAHPNGKEMLDTYERTLLSSSIWQLGNSAAPQSFGEKYRAEVHEIFSRARANAGYESA